MKRIFFKNTLNWKSIVRALRHRNYRLFFSGQSISLIGTWMQQIALSWLVYRLTDSAFLLGLVGFCSQISSMILAPLAGVIADRHKRHRLLLVTQSLAMVQAIVLYLLFVSHALEVWHIMVLSLWSGIINAFDVPVRQAFTVEMIEHKEDLPNAIALNSSMVNAAKLIGPSIGGLLIAAAGEGTCFLINAISYIAVLYSLLSMKLKHHEPTGSHPSIRSQLKEGVRYAYHHMPIRSILVLLAVISFIGGGAQILMPVFARDIFHGGARTLGFLMASSGLGALGGAIFLANRTTVVGLGRIITWSSAVFGLGLIAFACAVLLPLNAALLLCTGFGMMVQMAASNTMLQTLVDEDKRGRVMSFYAMAFMGMAPFGSLLAGGLTAHIGASKTLLIGGICSVIAAIWFFRQLPQIRKIVRPVYIEKGIISEIVH